MTKTFMKYPGNKSSILKQLLPLVPEEYNTYFEPMVGSGALFLALEPEKAVINDINKDVINVWKSVQKYPERLLEDLLKLTKSIEVLDRKGIIKVAEKLFKEYTKARGYYKKGLLYLFIKQLSFMGMFHVTKGINGLGNISDTLSFSKPQKIASITKANKLLEGVQIYNKDYHQILKSAKKGDFVYLDPPYVHNMKKPILYNKKGEEDILEELKTQMGILTKKGVYMMISNSDVPEVREAFKDYHIKTIRVFRCFRNVYENELVITNY